MVSGFRASRIVSRLLLPLQDAEWQQDDGLHNKRTEVSWNTTGLGKGRVVRLHFLAHKHGASWNVYSRFIGCDSYERAGFGFSAGEKSSAQNANEV